MSEKLRSLAAINGVDAAGRGRDGGSNFYPYADAGSITFDTPGQTDFSVPYGLHSFKVEVWGGGAGGGGGLGTEGGVGGSGAGFASAVLGGPLLVGGSKLVIEVGEAGAAGKLAESGGDGGNSVLTSEVGTVVVTGRGGDGAGFNKGSVTQAGTVASSIVTGTGVAGASPFGDAGGAGGKAAGSGGAGGAGGVSGQAGTAGASPGGGGGAGGFGAGGAAGAPGKVVISWPT